MVAFLRSLLQNSCKMNGGPKGPQAARLGQRKCDLLRRFPIPDNLLPGAVIRTNSRCGKPTCHCVEPGGRIEKVKLDLL